VDDRRGETDALAVALGERADDLVLDLGEQTALDRLGDRGLGLELFMPSRRARYSRYSRTRISG
jgi:hypothetical protein